MLSRLVDNVEERGLVLLNLQGIYLPEADIINLFTNNAKLGLVTLIPLYEASFLVQFLI